MPHEKVGNLLGKKRNTIVERLNDEKEIDSYSFIEAVSMLTGLSMHYLYHGYEAPASTYPSLAAEPDAPKYTDLVKRITDLEAIVKKKGKA